MNPGAGAARVNAGRVWREEGAARVDGLHAVNAARTPQNRRRAALTAHHAINAAGPWGRLLFMPPLT